MSLDRGGTSPAAVARPFEVLGGLLVYMVMVCLGELAAAERDATGDAAGDLLGIDISL